MTPDFFFSQHQGASPLLAFTRPVTLFAAFLVVTCFLSAVRRHRKKLAFLDIPGPPCPSYLTGNFLQVFDHISGIQFREHIRQTYGTVSKISGPLGEQDLVISDPMALSYILKSQDQFDETEWFLAVFRHAFGPCLVSSTGALHRRQRKILNPVFSTQRVRSMTPLFHKITNQVFTLYQCRQMLWLTYLVQLRDILQAKVANGPQDIDIMAWLGPLALEMIAQSGLGHTFDSFNPQAKDSEFRVAIKEFAPAMGRLFMFRTIFPFISKLSSKILRFGAACLPLANVHHAIRVASTMHSCAKHLLETKKAMLTVADAQVADQISGGKDIIGVLMKTNIDAPEEFKMHDDEIIAQMLAYTSSTLLSGGTDPTSTAMSHILLLLAQHQDVQEKLRHELNLAVANAGGDELGYEDLTALTYLDAICRETLRLHPPANFIARLCRADTTIPLSEPIPSAAAAGCSLFVPRGTIIFIDVINVNREQSIWGADSRTWKPERRTAPLPDSVADARIPGVYSNTLTFLGGGRACIGLKLAELEMKVMLSQFIRSFRFYPSETEVVWRYGPITTPSVKGSTGVSPNMPIVLEKI
ncbi:cytochrome P450 [Artomyces pyxidatus]|uniref:Cytochrome P450 n=1 Tax=Artomyces pyxidatus TaxID=48021 RepID=A0ACB8SMI1_9AGAM|nr:cytochrome P450 [Artomyces pyxidatus]